MKQSQQEELLLSIRSEIDNNLNNEQFSAVELAQLVGQEPAGTRKCTISNQMLLAKLLFWRKSRLEPGNVDFYSNFNSRATILEPGCPGAG